jgi:hypothetical protein
MGCLQLTYREEESSPLKVSWNRNGEENPCTGVEKYLYNGKELQTELGLDWYDYGHMDPHQPMEKKCINIG